MAGNRTFFGSIRFTTDANLGTDDLLDDTLRIEGRISGGPGDDGSLVAEQENVGSIEAILIHTAP